jgi:hypothetical protein
MPDKEDGVTIKEIQNCFPDEKDRLHLDNEKLTEAVDRCNETIQGLEAKAKHWHDLVVKLSTKLAAIEMLCGAK